MIMYNKHFIFVFIIVFWNYLNGQEIIPRNKIKPAVEAMLLKDSIGNFLFEYAVTNLQESIQNIWNFDIIFAVNKVKIIKVFNPVG